jgi:PEGA domain
MRRNREMVLLVLVLVVAVGILRPGAANAESGLLVVGGGAAEHERTTVGTAIETAVRRAGWSLPAKPLPKKDIDRLLNCSDAKTPWTCVPPAVGAAGIQDVLVVSVESSQAENGAPMVVITGKLIVASPQSFAVRKRFCEHCADDKLAEASQDLTHQLIQELAARSGRTVVSIRSLPSSADITLDGTHVGATDATFNTFPGKHVATVQKTGFDPEVREFTAEEGKTADLMVTLRPSQPAVIVQPAARSWWSSPWVSRSAIGAGAALVVLGGVSIYRGQRFGGPDDRYEYTRATTIGVVTGLVGLAAFGGGLYLVWRGPDADAPGVGSGRTAIIVWSQRF